MAFNTNDDDEECPLCMEELDIAEQNFRPCPCGYQICRFCWHHIRENLNGRCPACRREYSDELVEYDPVSPDEIARIKREKKEKERQQRDMDAVNRRHLANMRVVQKNLVYVIGLHPKLATEDIIRSQDYFGQFGKIAKVVINKRPGNNNSSISNSTQQSAAVYVTYHRCEDANKAIHAVDGTNVEGRVLRASFGTTKYCTYYLRNMPCPNPSCLYLHEPGEESDMISKEELATGKHRMRDQLSTDDEGHLTKDFSLGRKPAPVETVATVTYKTTHSKYPSAIDDDKPALPVSASWGKHGNQTVTSSPSTPEVASRERSMTPDSFGPPLSVAVAASPPSSTSRKLDRRRKETPTDDALRRVREDAVIGFVLGDAFQRQLVLQDEDEFEIPSVRNGSSAPVSTTSSVCEDESFVELESLSPFDFLTTAPPRQPYMSSFNPFAHQILPSSLFDAPIRKTSRFGFAQV